MPSKSAQTLIARVAGLPPTILTDIVELLKEGRVSARADLQVIANFLSAGQSVSRLPQYKAFRDENTKRRHCVRCHATYTETANDGSSCIIPHAFDTEPTMVGYSGYDKVYSYKSQCCGSTVTLEEEGAGNNAWMNLRDLDMCYEGYHTEDVKDVEEEEDYEYNKVNIRRCEIDAKSGNCTRKCVYPDEEIPAFDWEFE